MDIDIANMLIYLKGYATESMRHGVENALRRDPGVVTVGLPKGKKHIVMVGYNPEQTDSLRLLQLAEASGAYPRVVGL